MVANTCVQESVIVKHLGCQDYEPIWQQMKLFTHNRYEHAPDEIWILEHAPVFTQGQAGKPEHILDAGSIPIVQSDRGGQVTYHAPGQLIIYFLTDLHRKNLNIRQFIDILEQAVIEFLNLFDIKATTKLGAPGVYIDAAKICSVGIRVRHGRTYHGLSLNVAMDLEPFTRINPCGYAGMRMAQIKDYVPEITVETAAQQLLPILERKLGYI